MTGSSFIGRQLKLAIRGASHAREIGMRLDGFPAGFRVDLAALQAFMERRAPGRDATSTARREPDTPEFLQGLDQNGVTTGETLDARIVNRDCRSQDYASVRSVPRPGHSDYPVWVKTGLIPAGGGCHSGRLTAPMCIAGGVCKQYLAARGISVEAVAQRTPEEILAVKQSGDSIGGTVVCRVKGMPKGLGWAMFDGIESELGAAIFGIPGVKALSFGDGDKAADMKGSEFNDALKLDENGQVTPRTNHSGGLTGGMTNGAEVVFKVTMRPTPSIYQEQDSVDLLAREETKLQIKGRHDPCIALRAVPVVEALTSLVMADVVLAEEARTPRICLTLTGKTLEENLRQIRENRDHIDLCELRLDLLAGRQEIAAAGDFPARAGLPVILTLRRERDGGKWPDGDDEGRARILVELLTQGAGFQYVDLETDFRRAEVEESARRHGARIIRSLHDFSGPVRNLCETLTLLKGDTDEIPKIAFQPLCPDDVTDAFRQLQTFRAFPYIVCAMGHLGKVTRILALRLGSLLTFASVPDAATAKLGQLTPRELVRTYRFRQLTPSTRLYAVTGWPLEVTGSPELNNLAFAHEQEDKVLVPFPARTLDEFVRFADTVGIQGSAVTVPHKEAARDLAEELDEAAQTIGAVNTLVRVPTGWKGYNTDAPGFASALCAFLGTEDLSGKRVLIVGAGGAAKAVAYAVHGLKGDAIICNRTLEKAELLAAKYWFRVGELEGLSPVDVIVQTTSVGLNSTDDALKGYVFTGREKIFDLVYHPAVTTAMRRCLDAGGQAENGWRMLIDQATHQRRIYREHE